MMEKKPSLVPIQMFLISAAVLMLADLVSSRIELPLLWAHFISSLRVLVYPIVAFLFVFWSFTIRKTITLEKPEASVPESQDTEPAGKTRQPVDITAFLGWVFVVIVVVLFAWSYHVSRDQPDEASSIIQRSSSLFS